MKIAWFTPFTKKSAIGKISVLICDALARKHEVEIWTQHKEDLFEVPYPVHIFDADFSGEELKKYDAVIYNMGNFAGYHREIYDVSQRFPGIVLLHDQTMADFWGQYHCIVEFGGKGDAGVPAYTALLKEYYGQKAADAVEPAIRSGRYPFYAHEALSGYSFIEPTIQGAKGIFTHASFFAERLRTMTNIPVGYAYLPYDVPDPQKHKDTAVSEIIRSAKRAGKKIVVSTGIVHPVKNIDAVADVLAEDRALATKICFVVIGEYGGEYGAKLEQQAKAELNGCLHMMGYMPDDAMEEALEAADLTVNLRYPNSEVCSCSLWEQMAAGNATLVFDSGVYGAVPDDMVVRIRRNNKKHDIRKALWDLVEGRLNAEIGESAREFVRENCTTKAYEEKLTEFLEELQDKNAVSLLQNRIVKDVSSRMAQMGLGESAVPTTYAAVIDKLSVVLGEPLARAKNKTLGVWIGFPYYIHGLSREGCSRLMGYLVSSLLRYHADVTVEVWSYSFNADEVRRIFESVQEEDRTRIQFITDKNWYQELDATAAQRNAVGEINESIDNLVEAVRVASKASVFIPIILYLDRIAESGKKLFVPGYDMAVASHYNEFIEKDPLYIARSLDINWRVMNLADHGADFFCNSDTARKSEIIKYVRNMDEKRTQVIYDPPNILEHDDENFVEEEDLRKRFGIKGRYLFYPTQIRPYKNVSTLVRAFAKLHEQYQDLKLVLTGNPKDLPEVDGLLTESGMRRYTVLLKDVSEAELYSLYRYCAAVPVTSYFEGGFHYQAMEGLLMEAPVVVADIPIVRERFASLNFGLDDCGIPLFEPFDVNGLVEALRVILEDREAAVERQKGFGESLLSYTWKEAADQYYQLFFFGRTEFGAL